MRAYTWLLFAFCLVPHSHTEVLFGELSSPGYPAPYPPSQAETWMLSVPRGYRLTLQFTHFDVCEDEEYCQDYVKVMDAGHPQVMACGGLRSVPGNIPEPLEFLSTSNTMTVKFASQAVQSRHFRGFHAVYTALASFDDCTHSRMACAHYCHNYPGGHFCSCAHGYTLGSNKASCEETGLLCSPEVPMHVEREPKQESYKASEEVTVTCLEGYEAVMPDLSSHTSYQATCQRDGQWSQYHHCQLMDCGPPTQIENGQVSYLSGADVNTYGASVQYMCTATYYELTPKGDGVYRCSSDAHWKTGASDSQVPECTPVCGFPSAPIKGVQWVIKGEPARAGSFPWQIFFRTPRGDGSLISDQWILTAAHVVETDIESAYAGLLSVSESILQSTTPLTIEKVFIHPSYKQGQAPIMDFDNDIALVKLEKKLKLGPRVSPICLPGRDAGYHMKEDMEGYISGWGNVDSRRTSILQMSPIAVTNMSECEKLDKHKNYTHTDNMICVGGGGKYSCDGDSGGAYVTEDPNDSKRYYVGGIVSWGLECGTYGLCTKVSNYLDWLEETMKNN